MKNLLVISIMFILLQGVISFRTPSVTVAQDGDPPCDLTSITSSFSAAFASATTVEDAQQVNRMIWLALSECTVTPDNISTAVGTRSDPVGFGQYFRFDKGLVRVVDFIDPYEWQNEDEIIFLDIPEGSHLIAFEVEYICELDDPDETCLSRDADLAGVVSTDGVIIDYLEGGVYRDDIDGFRSQEVFSGNTITGFQYMILPDGTELESVQMRLNFDRFIFASE